MVAGSEVSRDGSGRGWAYLKGDLWVRVPIIWCALLLQLRNELQTICKKALQLLETVLLPNAEAGEAKTFYLKMQGDAWSISLFEASEGLVSSFTCIIPKWISPNRLSSEDPQQKFQRCRMWSSTTTSFELFSIYSFELYFVLHLRHGLDFTALEHLSSRHLPKVSPLTFLSG